MADVLKLGIKIGEKNILDEKKAKKTVGKMKE